MVSMSRWLSSQSQYLKDHLLLAHTLGHQTDNNNSQCHNGFLQLLLRHWITWPARPHSSCLGGGRRAGGGGEVVAGRWQAGCDVFFYVLLLYVNLILKCSNRCFHVCLIPIIILAIKVFVRKIRGAERQHTWQQLTGRYIVVISCQCQCFSQHYSWDQLSVLLFSSTLRRWTHWVPCWKCRIRRWG